MSSDSVLLKVRTNRANNQLIVNLSRSKLNIKKDTIIKMIRICKKDMFR